MYDQDEGNAMRNKDSMVYVYCELDHACTAVGNSLMGGNWISSYNSCLKRPGGRLHLILLPICGQRT